MAEMSTEQSRVDMIAAPPAANVWPRPKVVSALMVGALLGSAAIIIALIAQGYFNRRLFLSDGVYLFVWAVALFVIAFPQAVPQRASLLRRDVVVQVLLVLLAGLVLAKVYQDVRQHRDTVVAVVFAFAPLMLIGVAFADSRASSRPDGERDVFLNTLWQRLTPTPAQTAVDRMLLIGGFAASAVSIAYWLRRGTSNDALVLTILALVLLMAALHRLDRGRVVAVEQAHLDQPSRWAEIASLVVIVAIAAFLRLWQLNTLPYGVWYDEAQAGQEAMRLLQGVPFSPMGAYTSNNPSPFFYAVAMLFKVTGPTLLSLRVVQALIGVATVPLLYLLLRNTLGWRAALAGALMIGVSAWHVDFSRFGMCCNIEAPPFEILTLFFLIKGLRTGKLADFAWGGLMMGLGQFTYASFRLFPIIIAAYALYGLLLNKERVRQSMAGLLIYATIAVVAFAPMGAWAWENRNEFMARTNQTSVFAGKNTTQEKMTALENSLVRHIKMFNLQGDGNGRHNLPGAPALDFFSGALFVIGLGYCLYRWRSPAFVLMALWLCVMMLSGIMSLDWEAPQMARTVVAIPAIYAIASIPLAKVWGAWDGVAAAVHDAKKRRAAQAVIGASVLAAAGLLLYLNVDRYFNLQANSKEVYYSYSTIETVVARRVAELGPTANRYYVQTQGTPAFSFLVGGDSKDRPVDAVFYRGYEHMPLRESITKTAVYLLEPWRVTLDPAHVLHYYPNATFVDHKDPFGNSIVYEFRLRPEDANGLLGLTGRYFAGAAWQGAPIIERTDRQIDFDWTGSSCSTRTGVQCRMDRESGSSSRWNVHSGSGRRRQREHVPR